MDRPTIFIADDDPDLVRALSIRCRSLGFQVETSHDASAAWRLIEKLCPDLVMLDINMPGGTGLGIAEMMAGHERLAQTPVIILTGQTDSDTVRRCHNLLAYYVLKGEHVWARVEPLIIDLLLREPSQASADQSNQPEPTPASTMTNEISLTIPAYDSTSGSSASSSGSQQQSHLMDAVFAAIGATPTNEQDQTNNGEAESTADSIAAEALATETNEQPWALLIDDDAEFSKGLSLRLAQKGIASERVFAGQEGFRKAFLSKPHLIVLDYEMPDGNGDYVLRRLKENPATRDIPVISLTGRTDKAIERQMLNLGAAVFTTKPYNWEQLWGEIEKFVPATVGV